MHKRWILFLNLMLTLVACRRSPTSPPTPIATAPPTGVGGRSSTGAVTASGEVIPASWSELSFPISGRVTSVAVEEGDRVQPGDLLITLDSSLLEADVAQTQAALAAAQARLALVEAGPRPDQLAVAQAQLAAAQATLALAAAQRARPDLGASDAEIAAAQAAVAAAQADRREANEFHDQTMNCVEVDLGNGDTKKICPALGPIEEQARLNAQAAAEAQTTAQAQLDALLAGASAEIRAAQAAVQAASGQQDAAQAQIDVLQAGATVEEIAAAQAAVALAEAELEAAQAQLAQATLRAPIAGHVVVLEISPGEPVMPSQALLTLADLGHLQVRTTDLSELDVARVSLGQGATVYVEPLGTEIEGRVARIASQAETVGGDIVYAVFVELDEQPEGLRWGMSVEVEIWE